MPEKIFIQQFNPGEEIVKVGEKGRNAYFIEKGLVEVSTLQNGSKTILANLGPGEIFGEMSMIDDAPRSATVRTKTYTEVIVIERSRFTQPLSSADPIMQLLLRVLLARFRDSQNLMNGVRSDAKKHGVSIDEIRNLAFDRIQRESRLREALKANQLELHYQPIICLNSGELSGLEALVRWRLEDGYVLPSKFIPLAEESGFIIDIGKWVLETALIEIHKIKTAVQNDTNHIKQPFLSLNVSSIQLLDPAETKTLCDIIKRSSYQPEKIKLEITESFLIGNPDHATSTLFNLKKLGVSITIDDFGTGYSSLSYLHKFPFDTLKIDQSFVKNLESSESSFTIVNCIIQLAKALNLSIVAEGIETQTQFKKLKELGCHFGQGFYMSKPLPLTELLSKLKKKQTWP